MNLLQIASNVLFLFFSALVQANNFKQYVNSGDYNGNFYGHPAAYGDEYKVSNGYGRRLIDDFICDLDASILVVTSSDKSYKKEETRAYDDDKKADYGNVQTAEYDKKKRVKRGEDFYSRSNNFGAHQQQHHQQKHQQKQQQHYSYSSPDSYSVAKAHRLRCSAIAVASDEDCRKCCHLAARKERSIAKDSIVGFVVNADELRKPSYAAPYQTGYQQQGHRTKRSGAPAPAYAPAPAPSYAPAALAASYPASSASSSAYKKEPAAQAYGSYPQKPANPQCICCAPKIYDPVNYGKNAAKVPDNSGETKKKDAQHKREREEEYNKNDKKHGGSSPEYEGGNYHHHHHHHHNYNNDDNQYEHEQQQYGNNNGYDGTPVYGGQHYGGQQIYGESNGGYPHQYGGDKQYGEYDQHYAQNYGGFYHNG